MSRRPFVLLLLWASGVCCSPQWRPQESPEVAQGVRNPLGGPPLAILKTLREDVEGARRTPSPEEDQMEATQRTNSSATASSRSLKCNEDQECYGYDLRMYCDHGHCTCRPPYCVIYQLVVSGWYSKYDFSCGSCGDLGSTCNSTIVCTYPGKCFDDGFCHCPVGENFSNICVVTDNSWMYLIALAGLGIIFVFAMAMVAYSVYKDPPWRRRRSWCFGLCNAGAASSRRGSTEKTPAFTVQSLYANQVEQISLETTNANRGSSSAQRDERPDDAADGVGEETGSVTSDVTQVTNLSLQSFTSIASTVVVGSGLRPPLLPEAEEGGATLGAESESLRSRESVASANSGCSHERCTLCLPKGLSTRPPSAGSPVASSFTPPPPLPPPPPPPPLGNTSRPRRTREADRGEEDFQCTSL